MCMLLAGSTTGLNNFNDVAVNKGDGGTPAFVPIYKQ